MFVFYAIDGFLRIPCSYCQQRGIYVLLKLLREPRVFIPALKPGFVLSQEKRLGDLGCILQGLVISKTSHF